MKLALTSDLHLGITPLKRIEAVFNGIKAANPDVTLILGDHCGGKNGAKATRTVMNLARATLGPDATIIACNGNHEYWTEGRRRGTGEWSPLQYGQDGRRNPSMRSFELNEAAIAEAYNKNNIHFLDKDGIWRDLRFPGVAIFGHTLWYHNPNPPTNDDKWLPRMPEGQPIHSYMYNRSYKEFCDTLDKLTDSDTVRIFCSHFPVHYQTNPTHGDLTYGGSPGFGTALWESGVRHFFNGHTHGDANGPHRWECGGDYSFPKFKIVEI
jgi:predicted phosphodiesterase